MSELAPPELNTRSPEARAIFLIAILFSCFQIYTAAFSPFSSIVLRSVHVGFVLLMVFALMAQQRPAGSPMRWFDWALGAGAFALAFYHWVFESDLIQRSGDPSTTDLVVGVVVVVLVFEAARRMMGWALPLICAAFLAYAIFGHLLPSPLNHRPYGFDQIVNQMYLGTEGIYGVPTYVSATYIFLFILFGAFLEQAGMIALFTDFSMGLVGHTKGGPAKVATVSSALMGTINGSGVANVVTTGQFTIPLMKRYGYRAEFAGAVEAVASMGGQIMPPVMGAVAFIMAETLNVPYVEIVKAAVIPAILYFLTILVMVHLEAGRAGLRGLPKEECPNPWRAMREKAHLILPLAALVYLLFAGYTPLFAGTVGLGLTVVLIFGANLSTNLRGLLLRVLFWVVIGALASAFFKYGIGAVFLLIAALALVNVFVRGGRETLWMAVRALAEGARHAIPVGIACTLVGTLIGVMTLTGLASQVASLIVGVAGTSLFLSLVMTMVACLLLGMGIPTIPNYIITSSLVGPALLDLGVPLIISHMFVFYFGIMADLTPPVALAAFAAAPIARASATKIGLLATRIGVAGYVVPFMAVYAPALMLQEGTWLDAGYVALKAVVAICLWASAVIGWGFARTLVIERLAAIVAASFLVVNLPLTDEIGFALAALVFLVHWWRTRSKVPARA